MTMQARLSLEMIRREAAALLGVPEDCMVAAEEYRGEEHAFRIALCMKGGEAKFITCDRDALSLSLNDFSERFVKPTVDEMRQAIGLSRRS